ncbi:cellulose biosynthesis protein BcsQ [Alcanivorax quisquiliarum]|uniref:Cellulose biosynthesis protein BcsQ n=1 Tax=Alcanivorax quisquiliarum TaxID=2933565 RepID=A0ABT0E423_9GAMM|nr:cellulose biosynthesis protein BcsQ [Alcanivorax quisquiliarum]MCK0536575.1 cellulose biosynthesis protein BcsQ [Alcanivorax quisquiliarum]
MAVISFASPKGGTGKTTLVANVAEAVHALGYEVFVLELDPQNTLRVHFGFPLQDDAGLAGAFIRDDWSLMARRAACGVHVLPFGTSTPAQRAEFGRQLAEPGFLRARLATLQRTPGALVLIDLPSGYSAALPAVAGVAQVRLTLLQADPGSIALLPLLQDKRYYGDAAAAGSVHRLLLNKVDNRTRLGREISEFMQREHGRDLIGQVHEDSFVPEAAAQQRLIGQYATSSRAARDVQQVARQLASLVMQSQQGSAGY